MPWAALFFAAARRLVAGRRLNGEPAAVNSLFAMHMALWLRRQ
jgi:hypothetical protein